jgi:hypothetical protein
MNARKLQCMTTAEWLRGYTSTLDQDRHSSLIHKMNQAAELLTEVWEEYLKESEK